MNNNISSFKGKTPVIHKSSFIDISARVIGEVVLEEGVSIWPMAVLRADSCGILIARCSAVLDQSLIEAPDDSPVTVGEGSIISHKAVIHGATIGANTLIGIGAIVLDDSTIGEGSIIGSGSVITPRTVVPPNSLVLGSPARIIRETSTEERKNIEKQVEEFYRKSRVYLESL